MISYRPPAYSPRLAQAVITPGVVTSTGISDVGSPVQGLLWTTVASAAAYAAIRTGMREKGFASIAGWVGGIGAGLAALIGLVGVASPATARALPVRWY